MAGESHITTDPKEIIKWVETRDGKPAHVKHTGGPNDAGLLRIDFPGYSGGESLEEISWDEFFQKFDERNLAFLYQDKISSGEESHFSKLISRDSAEYTEHTSNSGSKAQSVTHPEEHESTSKTHKAEKQVDTKVQKADEKSPAKAQTKDSDPKKSRKDEAKG